MTKATRVAAVLGLLAVALGAFGAHPLKNMGISEKELAIWQTAVLYHLVHAVAALWAADRRQVVTWIWAAGVLLFSGSLYLLVLTDYSKLAFLTPLGGGLFLVGWGLLIWKPR